MKKTYTVAIGKFTMPITKDQEQIMKIMREFKGLEMVDPAFEGDNKKGTLLFFETLNDAKEARNILRSEGVQTGKVIMEFEYEKDERTGQVIMGKGERIA